MTNIILLMVAPDTLNITIETCSPTYIRGMVHEATFKKASPDKDELDKEGLSDEEKEERAPFFSSSNQEREGKLSPVIPGSSLRGLVRNLVEIVAHGRMKWVAAQPTFTYRAVAVQGEDPLKRPYQDVMGDQNNRKVCAGYLVQREDNWFIHPAQTTTMIGWRKQDEPYIKIDDDDISAKALPGYLHLNHKNYRPQLHEIRFDEGPRVRKRKPGPDSSPDRPVSKWVTPVCHSPMRASWFVQGIWLKQMDGGVRPEESKPLSCLKTQMRRRFPLPKSQ